MEWRPINSETIRQSGPREGKGREKGELASTSPSFMEKGKARDSHEAVISCLGNLQLDNNTVTPKLTQNSITFPLESHLSCSNKGKAAPSLLSLCLGVVGSNLEDIIDDLAEIAFTFPSDIKMVLVAIARRRKLLNDEIIIALADSSMEILDISGSDVSDSGLCHVVNICQNLRAVDIRQCTRLTPSGVSKLLQLCHSLEILRWGSFSMESVAPIQSEEISIDNEPQNEAAGPSTGMIPSSGSKRVSPMWDHFIKIPCENKKLQRATCKYCQTNLACPPANGTSCLKNHLSRCKKYPCNVDKKQSLLSFTGKVKDENCGSEHTFGSWIFDQEKCKEALAKMIMKDELPFKHVEHEGFRDFCSEIQPQFVVPSRRTISRKCYDIFLEERKKLKKCLAKCNKVSLTTDTWTSCQNFSYMCLTAHFIDDDWKLQKKILNFCPISGHSGEIIGKTIECCLLSWGISRVMTVTMDNASSNDVGIVYLKKRLNSWNGTLMKGDFLHMRCAAHILNLVVKDGLEEIKDSIYKIRSVVKYVRSSPSRLQKFKACVEKERIESKCLVVLDVETRWNSTYLMLESAVKFQKAFELLELEDSKFRKELQLPIFDDWDNARNLMPFLKMFYDTTVSLSGSLYVTSNEFVTKIYGLGILIKRQCNDGELGHRLMASKMKRKFDKYWGDINNINCLLFVATVLDPRYKMDYVNFIINEVYESEKTIELLAKVKSTLENLYDFYSATSSSLDFNKNVVVKETINEKIDNVEDLVQSLYKRQKVVQGVRKNKNELEKYLGDDCEGEGTQAFIVLDWWKLNSSKYPVLSCIARDVLAIPVSTVASESAFSTGGRVLDQFRSSLTPRMVEALVCAQDWLRRSHHPIFVEESLSEMESLESKTCMDEHILVSIEEE